MSVPRKEDEDSLQELYNRFYTVRGKLFAKYAYCRRVKKDQEVGCDNGKGYLIVMSKGKLFLVHRIINYLETGKWPLSVVDHINGNPKDNRISNLRSVSQGENTRSFGGAHRGSTSNYRGVHWYKSRGKWQAQIMCEGKRKHLGYFNSEVKAAYKWNKEAIKLGFNPEALNTVEQQGV